MILPHHPPITHVDLYLHIFGDPAFLSLSRDCRRRCMPTLKSMRINPGSKSFPGEDYTSLDLTQFKSIQSFTIEPADPADYQGIFSVTRRFLSLVLSALGAPELRKLTVIFVLNRASVVATLDAHMNWAALGNCIDRHSLLEDSEAKFVLCGSQFFRQNTAIHTIESQIRNLLPHADASGKLHAGHEYDGAQNEPPS
ncbi:hypothetical protein BD626DRAFT_628403 [Schizophyllum amplum]|uniref:Uncharacterized protein n=1 Tax=Schizophyllum amplum TaxID=97359 RepID=A0A550CK34_9AGAR|nr:hypothetical protein BD626DRAFT_628403 [Auriculariopsis ampla]